MWVVALPNLCNRILALAGKGVEPKYRDPARALTLAEKTVKLLPKDPVVRHVLGEVYYRARNWQAAKRAFSEAMELGGPTPHAQFFLAMIDWQQGNKQEARAWYNQAATAMADTAPSSEVLRAIQAQAGKLLGIGPSPKPGPSPLPRGGGEADGDCRPFEVRPRGSGARGETKRVKPISSNPASAPRPSARRPICAGTAG